MWKDVDANGSPSSGAADLTNAFSQPGRMGGGDIEQCVPVTGGASYAFGAKAFIPSQSNTGYAQAQVAFYSGTNCGGSFLSLASTLHVTQIAAWGQVAVAGALAPAGAMSADFALAHFKNEAGGEFVTYFDLALGRPPPVLSRAGRKSR